LDFVYLNVAGLLGRYSNPAADWHSIVRALAWTQLEFFRCEGLLKQDPGTTLEHIDTLTLNFDAFTDEGKAFLKSGAVDRWLEACDRRGTVYAYRNPDGLKKRLEKFRKR
jgi:hypothetical protein